jgi:biofilm protein TabA
MVIDTLSNAGKYSCLHPLFGKAFEYIQSQDLETIAPGNYEIDGDSLKAAVFDKTGKTKAESLQKFECHNKYIDIQVCIRGNEQIGWKPRETCHDLKGEYNPEKDVSFYNDQQKPQPWLLANLHLVVYKCSPLHRFDSP